MALLPVAEARNRILADVTPTAPEQVPIAQATGRTLAEDLRSRVTQPPFNASAMDGYAVRAQDIATAPVTLDVIGEAPAGAAFSGAVGPGQAVRVFTGAPVPEGADTVVIQENTEPEGQAVRILQTGQKGQFVRQRGLDFEEGEVLLASGTLLGSREIALAAAMNHATLPVRRRPRVTIIPTGDELVPPGGTPGPDQIISSNNFAMAAFTERCGGAAFDLGVTGDTSEALAEALSAASETDILLTLGGASVGKHDLVQDALLAHGMTLDFWKIAMRPGKPLIFGRLGDIRVLGFPGNPVSAFVCAEIFLRPLIEAMLGRPAEERLSTAVLGADLRENDERQDYLRAKLSRNDRGDAVATPFPRQDSSMLRTLAEADCMIVRPPFDPARSAGAEVTILPCGF